MSATTALSKTDNLPAIPTAKQPEKLKITGKVRTAIQSMVWQGLKRDEAAEKAGIKDNSLYVALRRPDVKAFYLAELDVLRTSERARNIHALVDVRDTGTNQMATVAAVKALEQMSDETGGNAGGTTSPGVVIQIINGAPERVQMQSIEQHPIITVG